MYCLTKAFHSTLGVKQKDPFLLFDVKVLESKEMLNCFLPLPCCFFATSNTSLKMVFGSPIPRPVQPKFTQTHYFYRHMRSLNHIIVSKVVWIVLVRASCQLDSPTNN